MPVAPAGSLILVTGGTGYVGTHTILAYLEAGFKVRATSTTQEKVDAWLAKTGIKEVEWFVTGDGCVEGAYDAAAEGVAGIAHVSTPYHLRATDPMELITPQMECTLNVLKAAQKSGTVQRVVVTSSIAALQDIDAGLAPGTHLDESSWGPATIELAKASADDPVYAYFAAKKLGEEAAWKWMGANTPDFDMATVNPASCFGPPLQAFGKLENLDAATLRFYNYLRAYKKDLSTPYPTWVAVRDVGLVHVRAMTILAAGGHRFATTAGPYVNGFWVNNLRAKFPEKLSSLPEVTDPAWAELQEQYTVDTSPAEQILGIKWRTMEEATEDAAVYLWKLEENEK